MISLSQVRKLEQGWWLAGKVIQWQREVHQEGLLDGGLEGERRVKAAPSGEKRRQLQCSLLQAHGSWEAPRIIPILGHRHQAFVASPVTACRVTQEGSVVSSDCGRESLFS